MTSEAPALGDALALVERLGQEVQDLRAALAELERRVAELIAENRVLQDQLDESRRQVARQAAPFRRASGTFWESRRRNGAAWRATWRRLSAS